MGSSYKASFPTTVSATYQTAGRRGYSGVSGPTNTVAPVVSGTTESGSELSCTSGTWSGTGSLSYAYQWQRDSTNIASATASAYTLVGDDVGTNVRCVVTATDDNGSTARASNAVGPITAPAAEPWAGYYTAAGLTNSTAQTAVANFYAGLSTDGIQSKVRVFVILAGESATAKNVMQDAYHGTLVNTPTFTAWVGQRFNGTTSYVSVGTALNAITGPTQNSMCIGGGVAKDAPAVSAFETASILGANDTNYTGMAASWNEPDASFYASNAVNDAYGAGYNTAEPYGSLAHCRTYASRTASTGFASYYNGAAIDTDSSAVTSTGVPAYAPFFGAYNNAGTPDFNAGDALYEARWYMISEGMTSGEVALFDARVVTLMTALGALA